MKAIFIMKKKKILKLQKLASSLDSHLAQGHPYTDNS